VLDYLPGSRPPADAPSQRVLQETERARAGDAEAQLSLAILYAKGDGVAQDYAAAAKWFRAAAERGLMRAQYDLGVLYERGRGVRLDHRQAVTWYRKAAEQNHPLAQYNLAVAYTKGQGVRQNFVEAAVWYHRAAAQGVVAAMVNLAILYERGEGVESSTVDAYSWYRAAARRGSQPAARRAEELLQAFSPLEQTRAEAKTLDINASIRDAIGEGARLAARKPPAAPPAQGGPVLKSGLDGGRISPRAERRPENP
jgi:TPR repeat protein